MPICLRLLKHWMRAAASRTFWTAGTSRPMRIAIIAITTSSSISVKARRGRSGLPGEERSIEHLPENGVERGTIRDVKRATSWEATLPDWAAGESNRQPPPTKTRSLTPEKGDVKDFPCRASVFWGGGGVGALP